MGRIAMMIVAAPCPSANVIVESTPPVISPDVLDERTFRSARERGA